MDISKISVNILFSLFVVTDIESYTPETKSNNNNKRQPKQWNNIIVIGISGKRQFEFSKLNAQ